MRNQKVTAMFLSFEKRTKLFLYILIWILYAILHTVSMCFITHIPVGLLLIDAVIHATLFAVLGILFWHVLLYGKYETLIPIQRFINYIALALLVISLWLGTGFLLDYFLLREITTQLIPTLPIRGMIGLLLYLIFILSFSLISKQNTQQSKEFDLESENLIIQAETHRSTDITPEIVERITVKAGQKLHIIPIKDIIYIQSDGDYVQLVTEKSNYLKEETMKFFETSLPKKSFVRIHRSYIVNIEYVSRIESYGKQNQQIALKNGQWLKVSASGYKSLKEALHL